YTDSDAYKWGEATSLSLIYNYNEFLKRKLDEFVGIISKAQDTDGYLYTFNQYHFPNKRWENLLIEHELYCMGHWLEFAIAYFKLTKNKEVLDLAKKTADIVYNKFIDSSPIEIPGHPEIEIALIKLYRITKVKKYLELAKHFIEKRGQSRFFFFHLLKQNFAHSRKEKEVKKQKLAYYKNKDYTPPPNLFEGLAIKGPKGLKLRAYYSFLSGKYFQAHKPIKKTSRPVGHSVRWGYLATAATMLSQENQDNVLLKTLEKAWDNMVKKRMYITGGIGSLPLIEGFGRDYELHPKYAYCETCAAISSIYWSWELFNATRKAQYTDLMEWQLYNAMLVGIALDGTKYFYHNPLEAENMERKSWYLTACCPSNIARTIAKISNYIYLARKEDLWVNQYISNKAEISPKKEVFISSSLPFGNKVLIHANSKFILHLRIPSWAKRVKISVNDEEHELTNSIREQLPFDPYKSYYWTVPKKQANLKIELEFNIDPTIRFPHPNDKYKQGKVALSRGPMVYCFENIDNKMNLREIELNLEEPIKTKKIAELDNITALVAKHVNGEEIIAIPYYAWANRKKAEHSRNAMTVWVKAKAP
ncbi:MAG: glycoside hydrolase family 127 protein, partial [Candidatus Heimdallarchaeaceae archaeon]